jgi:hypothetical protein
MSKPSVFIMSSFIEGNVDAVISLFEERRIHWFRFNTETFPLISQIRLHCSTDGDFYSLVSTEDQHIDTREVTAVWNRRIGGFVLPMGLVDQDKDFVRSECIALIGSMCASLTCPWVNPTYSEFMSGPKSYRSSPYDWCKLLPGF